MNQVKDSGKTLPPLKKSRTMMLRWLSAAAAVVIASAVFFLPVFVSSRTGNKFILAEVNSFLPGKTAFSSLSMSWFGGIVITNFGFRDSSSQVSIRIRRIVTKPYYGSLALGVLSFGRTVVDEPVVEINLKDRRLGAKQQPQLKMSAAENFNISIFPVKKIGLIVIDGRLRVSQLQAAQSETVELSAINARIEIASGTIMKKVSVSSLRFEAPQIKIDNGQCRLVSMGGMTNLEGRFDYAYDWATLSDLVKEFLPKDLELKGKQQGTINFSSEYPNDEMNKFWANLNTSVKVGFERADYMGLIFEPTEIDIEAEKGLLTIESFSSKANNGRLNFAGQVDFRHEPVLLKTTGPVQVAKDIQITEEMMKRLLGYLNPVFVRAVNVSGIVNLNCERLVIPIKGGNKNDIETAGTISVEHLHLESSELFGQILAAANIAQAADITIRPTKFVLQNGLLRYDDMQMDVGDSPINFKGVIGLDKSLNMTVTLPYTTKGETAKLDRETTGRRITLVLRGTLDKPRIDVGKVLQEQLNQELGGQLKGKLLEGLDKLLK